MATTLVIFGITGDLAQRKLLPALSSLERKGQLPPGTKIIGVGRRKKTSEELHEDIRTTLARFATLQPTDTFLSLFSYHQMEFHSEAGYEALKSQLGEQTIYYLSTPPNLFGTITRHLRAAGMTQDAKVAFEKPFGNDLQSARELNNALLEGFTEEQIYRVDHYIGKSAIQNIFTMRFANTVFESLLCSQYVDSIQITAAESIGVEDRGEYYESAGALRDMVQSHLLQILALLTMAEPASLQPHAIHEQKQAVLDAVQRPDKFSVQETTVRAQYGAGTDTVAYRDEENVEYDSATETFVALKLLINTDRWRDVPVYIRTGKRLPKKRSYVSVVFKQPPSMLFSNGGAVPNTLTIEIQPNETISFTVNSKTPESKLQVTPVNMDFSHEERFGSNTPEAYERLFFDIFMGDKMLFPSWKEVESSWEIVQPMLDACRMVTTIETYEPGTMPASADALIRKDGREWL